MNTSHNKIVPIAIGVAVGIFAISMLLRFALFSEYGIPTSYLLFGLPGAGIGLVVLLLRLGVFTGGQRSSGGIAPWQQSFGVQPQYPGAPAPQLPGAEQSLRELDSLYYSGALSPEDYAERRQRIIATI